MPVHYSPHYKTKVVKTVTTEEMTDDHDIELEGGLDGHKAVYYSSIEDAKEDIKRIETLEESKVKELNEAQINALYSGDVVKTYNPVKTTFLQSKTPMGVRKRLEGPSDPINSWRQAVYSDETNPVNITEETFVIESETYRPEEDFATEEEIV